MKKYNLKKSVYWILIFAASSLFGLVLILGPLILGAIANKLIERLSLNKTDQTRYVLSSVSIGIIVFPLFALPDYKIVVLFIVMNVAGFLFSFLFYKLFS